MKMLNMNLATTAESLYDLKAIPANLHDVAEEVHGDVLYSLYTVTNSVIDNNIRVTLNVANLVEHTAGNGVKGYWVGIGISADLIQDSTVYATWDSVDNDAMLLELEPVEPDSEQEYNSKMYKTFYFNAKNANAHDNMATIIVDKDGIHYQNAA